MFNFKNLKKKLKTVFTEGTSITDVSFIEREIKRFKMSQIRHTMFDGERYYMGDHDILKRKRNVIGGNGELVEISNIPNNKIVDNQYKKIVDQKSNYLLGKPLAFRGDNDIYIKEIEKIFNKRFMKLIKNICEDSLNCGIGWVFLNYDEFGGLTFKRFKPYEIIAGWSDSEHTKLDYIIRIYEVIAYEGQEEKVIEKVEVYDDTGISFFELNKSGNLEAIAPFKSPYMTFVGEVGEVDFNWDNIPIIPFKYNNKEIPLIKMVKSLQDGLNLIESNFQNQMEEDPRNTILVIVNYGDENLGEFRHNLSTYGAIKLEDNGDVRTLSIEVNSENYKTILELFKKAIIENGMGYDAKDDRMSGNPNQMNIRSMYSDIDLDANSMETEFQASFEQLLWFVNNHLENTGKGSFYDEKIDVIFNRDILINENEVIENCVKSLGMLSDETLIANHPWVNDVLGEIKRKDKELEKGYDGAFGGGDLD